MSRGLPSECVGLKLWFCITLGPDSHGKPKMVEYSHMCLGSDKGAPNWNRGSSLDLTYVKEQADFRFQEDWQNMPERKVIVLEDINQVLAS